MGTFPYSTTTMTPVDPPEYNTTFGAPDGMSEAQVQTIRAFAGEIPRGGALDGALFVVVAWKPTLEELEALNGGGLVYISCLGGLPPHFLTTDFEAARYGQG